MVVLVAFFLNVLILPYSKAIVEDGYDMWLRYRLVNTSLLPAYRSRVTQLYVESRDRDIGPIKSAIAELQRGISRLLNISINVTGSIASDGAIVFDVLHKNNDNGNFSIFTKIQSNYSCIVVRGGPIGVLYASFRFLSWMQLSQDIPIKFNVTDSPKNQLRIWNLWDNVDGSVERGYAGKSIIDWENLPTLIDRYTDFSRLLASVGINSIAIENVNACKNDNDKLLKDSYLKKVAPLVSLFGSYGIQSYLTVCWASPIIIDKLKNADPLDKDVIAWWKTKTNTIKNLMPDFNGFLIKADSEGQPGPATYHRTEAEGANMLAIALAPHDGLVLWRAFVYGNSKEDRARQAYDTFAKLDGQFLNNVIVQIKNGPIDFQVREPVHSLFGQLNNTNVLLEVQVTQEYTGQGVYLCNLASQWNYYLSWDLRTNNTHYTLADHLQGPRGFGIAGVSNIGSDRNWVGNPLDAANTYSFGRLSWNPLLSPEAIIQEWSQMNFDVPEVVKTVKSMLDESWQITEFFTSPLGVGFMCSGDHYKPDPGHRQTYHNATKNGVGYDRTRETGSAYVDQYAFELANTLNSLELCPEEQLLFFHHVPYTHKLTHPRYQGKNVIQWIYSSHYAGYEKVKDWEDQWAKLEKLMIDDLRWNQISSKLKDNVNAAKEWRDTICSYFEKLSGIPINSSSYTT